MQTITLVLCLAAAIGVSVHSQSVPKTYKGDVYVHIMPWFETPASNGGAWGQHWTMANRNPEIVDGSGRRQIAAYYYPDIGPYASGDEGVIEYQLLLMKYSGVTGIFIDWPGTLNVYDYPKNKQNSEAIIRVAQRVGLKFAIVYEDHNLGMARDAGFISDVRAAARNDMAYLRDNYFNQGHYVRVNGAPLLLDFGPQTLKSPADWDNAFSVFSQKPTFLTLWYQNQDAGANAAGEYCWIYSDFLDGLRNYYNNRQLNVKFGGAYPGFNTFYAQGGWGGPTWTIPVGPDTFRQTLQLALNANVQYIQINTWNDYGEGTIVEPTREFGNQYLTILQQQLGVKYTERELNIIKTLYNKRKANANNAANLNKVNQAASALISLQPDVANQILNTL